MERQEFEVMQSRLHKLEQRLHEILAGWVLSMVVLVVLGATVEQATSQQETLRARNIKVVDEAGQTRINLGVSEGVPVLVLSDAAGRTRVGMSITRAGIAGLAVLDATERPRIVLSVNIDGNPVFQIYDGTGRVLFKAP